MKELKKEFEFHFNLPQFIKSFLHELSFKPTFIKHMNEKLSYVDDKYKDYVSKNRWLLFDYQQATFNNFIENEELGRIAFGLCGFRQYDNIIEIEINFKKEKAHITRGYCYNPYCLNPASKEYKIPKHSIDLVNQLFRDYKKWKEENKT